MFKYISLVLSVLAVSRGVPVNDAPSSTSSADLVAAALVKFHGLENEMLPPVYCTNDKIKVNYKLYTRESPYGHRIDPKYEETLEKLSFNIRDDTKIVIHDWLQNESLSYSKDFASAFLKNKKERVNVITVDYGSVSRCGFEMFLGMQSAIGEDVGRLLKSLIQFGTITSKLHLIGLGMGAQISGYVAGQLYPKKVGRLTALNPTFIGFMIHHQQLLSENSEYMDVIHTAQRQTESVKYLGSARFFPNDGTRQPISANIENDLEASIISHIASAIYYLQSIVDVTYFKGRLCENYMKFLLNECKEPAVYNYMGEGTNLTLKGDFYLKTDVQFPPFGKHPVDVKVFDLYRPMEVKVRAVKEVSAAQLTLGKQTYEKQRNPEQPHSEEDFNILITQYSFKKN